MQNLLPSYFGDGELATLVPKKMNLELVSNRLWMFIGVVSKYLLRIFLTITF